MKRVFEPRTFGTHDGTFHADEVSACALLLLFDLIDRDKIRRTRDPKVLDTCEFVCDVGGVYDPDEKLFDHHQVDYAGPMSSAGMVLLYLKERGYLKKSDYDHLNGLLIKGVDDHDNGKDPQIPGLATYSHVIANFTPIRYDATGEEQDASFMEAVTFSLGHIKRLRERLAYVSSCKDLVDRAMREGKDLLEFNESIPWVDLFFELGGEGHPAKFLVMPSKNGWKLRGIPPTQRDKMSTRLPLPRSWGGLLGDDLKKASGIEGAIFCHKGGFISVWETKEDALKAFHKIMGGLR